MRANESACFQLSCASNNRCNLFAPAINEIRVFRYGQGNRFFNDSADRVVPQDFAFPGNFNGSCPSIQRLGQGLFVFLNTIEFGSADTYTYQPPDFYPFKLSKWYRTNHFAQITYGLNSINYKQKERKKTK